MAKEVERIELTEAVELRLPDGHVYRVRPGPYGKGLAVSVVLDGQPNGRGRRPRPSTVALRRRLEADARKGAVKEAREYVRWLLSQDGDVSLAVARQVVYRERRRVLEA